jgi:hypothetical protein
MRRRSRRKKEKNYIFLLCVFLISLLRTSWGWFAKTCLYELKTDLGVSPSSFWSWRFILSECQLWKVVSFHSLQIISQISWYLCISTMCVTFNLSLTSTFLWWSRLVKPGGQGSILKITVSGNPSMQFQIERNYHELWYEEAILVAT